MTAAPRADNDRHLVEVGLVLLLVALPVLLLLLLVVVLELFFRALAPMPGLMRELRVVVVVADPLVLVLLRFAQSLLTSPLLRAPIKLETLGGATLATFPETDRLEPVGDGRDSD
eukprot:CAMPEP_0175163572 /NCGR_PEP_ID=MMETSP0087-20121206/25852_1 /TAXON_ID=136419 /ORGANISM="Unknown Unknown, Strain D1" /LENGTH=114 /DNA_ID=CAMNT_0016452347 /DNA_START=723 /DNA_END=1067 /DNA_ORIENTATION=+